MSCKFQRNALIFDPVYQQIKAILISTINGLKQSHPHAFICKKQRTFAIFGFDFMVGSDMRIWLLKRITDPVFR